MRNTEATITVSVTGTLWQTVIDSIESEARYYGLELGRRSGAWVWTRSGWGEKATAQVPREFAVYLAGYFRSLIGIHAAIPAAEGKAQMSRMEGYALRSAQQIEAQLA